ncbi:MAG: tRNA (guanosine(46)-N7)-methyltransferase TrmB [Chthoniobacterales bacterium]
MTLSLEHPEKDKEINDSPLEVWLQKKNPLEVDLGCGKGLFLTSLAQQFPDICFLGVEHQRERVAKCMKKIRRMEMQNAHALCAECEETVEKLFPPDSVDCFYVLCPDPWPKRRHHRRRMMNADFVESIRSRLKPAGILRMLTDDKPYFDVMDRLCDTSPGFERCDWDQGREFPVTDFQKHFMDQGLPIYRAAIRRN